MLYAVFGDIYIEVDAASEDEAILKVLQGLQDGIYEPDIYAEEVI
jgi:hypothetical protein